MSDKTIQKININGKEYNLDINKAIELGILNPARPEIKSFNVGDVFVYGSDPTRTDLYGVIARVNIKNDNSLYCLLGATCEGLCAWNTGTKYEMTYQEMLSFLNTSPYTFCKNIADEFNILLRNIDSK